MRLDPLFLVCAAGAIIIAITLAISGIRSRRISVVSAAVLTVLFGCGLLLQAFAPHLEIQGDKFVVPERDSSGEVITDPIRLVERDRRMNLWSAALLSISATGLAIICRASILSTFTKRQPRIQTERREAQHH